ncbi:hypothetical protein EDC01DRAFT_728137 [Geopyxis carbonaria]|nr:hypothetical protein EDC01DRAFT_728137 [Geopyxis carbonaria]
MSRPIPGFNDEHQSDLSPPAAASPYHPEFDRHCISPVSPVGNKREYGYSSVSHTELSQASSAAGPSTESLQGPDLYNRGIIRRTSDMFRKWSTSIHWYVPTAMVFVFLLGVCGAVGHHSFYTYLHDKPAKNQLFMNRCGTALAFFTKATLVGSIVLAYRQRLWQTVRTKAITVRGLDALFSIIEDPSWFVMSREILSKARVASLMALATWLIPIASVIAPGSLTTASVLREYPNNTCLTRNLEFSYEGPSDWKKPRHGRKGFNIAFFNETQNRDISWYDRPSENSNRIVTLAVYADKSLDKPITETVSSCPGYNCTYVVNFEGPWYNCTSKPFADSPFNASEFAPKSARGGQNYVYKSQISPPNSEYNATQSGNMTVPEIDAAVRAGDIGVFTFEPMMWMGYVVNSTKRIPGTNNNSQWEYELEQRSVLCVHQKANYEVTSRWTDGVVNRTTKVTGGRDLLAPGQELHPQDRDAYRVFASYHAIGKIVRDWISGDLTQKNTADGTVTHSKISSTQLVDQTTSWPYRDLPRDFTRFYENIVLSFLSEKYFEIALEERRTCPSSRYENLFQYEKRGLWISYSIAIVVAFVCIIMGALSINHNGMCSDITFSKIMVTTRNRTLDALVKSYPGVALGGHPVPQDLENTRLRFGVIDDEDDSESAPLMKHTAFGLAGETKLIDKFHAEKAQNANPDVELGSRGPWAPGSGLGMLPG